MHRFDLPMAWLALLLASSVLFGLGARAPAVAATSTTCKAITQTIERREGIPEGLLYAIALTESGRWDPHRKESYAWPWTVRAKDDAFVEVTASRALDIVRGLQRSGRRNIDVGCMQVNLMYHGEAFGSLEEAIDPERNITYAATFLKRLRAETRSWATAVERYHSSDPGRGRAYRQRVIGNWNKAKREPSIVEVATGRTTSPRTSHARTEPTPALEIEVVRPNYKSAGAITPEHAAPAPAANDENSRIRRPGGIVAIHGLDVAVRTSSFVEIYRPAF